MQVQYRIGEFASLAGVSIKTLRFYDEIGLFRPAAVDARTRYRHYLPQQLEQLASILALKDLGIPLFEIRDVFRKNGPCKTRKALLLEAKRNIQQSIQSATRSLQWINAALDELDSTPVAVVLKRRPSILIASVRAKVRSYQDVVPLEQELLDSVPDDSLGHTRGVLWHSCADSGVLDGEPFVAIKRPQRATSVYDVRILPEATMACAYSEVDDDKAEQTYLALKRWIGTHGFILAGPKREICLDGMLEIQFPVTSGAKGP